MEKQNIKNVFAENLKYYLKINNKTQKDLADYLGVSTTVVNYYVKGKNTPRMDKVDKICEFFGIQRSDLIGKNQYDLPINSQKQNNFQVMYRLNTEGMNREDAEDLRRRTEDFARMLRNDILERKKRDGKEV